MNNSDNFERFVSFNTLNGLNYWLGELLNVVYIDKWQLLSDDTLIVMFGIIPHSSQDKIEKLMNKAIDLCNEINSHDDSWIEKQNNAK